MNIEILEITLIKTVGVDKITLKTNMPCPYIPSSLINEALYLQFETSNGFGEQYIKNNFPNIPLKIINTR